MEPKLQHLINYTQQRLATANLQLSDHGKAEIIKRFKLPSDKGGYSSYWK